VRGVARLSAWRTEVDPAVAVAFRPVIVVVVVQVVVVEVRCR